MQSQTEVGRRLVLIIIIALLTMSVLVAVTFNMTMGHERLPQQAVRLFLTIGLCIFLYRGANWARWVTVVLYGVGGVWALATLTMENTSLLLVIMGLVYVTSAAALLFLPSVRANFVDGTVKPAQLE